MPQLEKSPTEIVNDALENAKPDFLPVMNGTMHNEFAYKANLCVYMDAFLQAETNEKNEFGHLTSNLAKAMTEAAFAVLKLNSEVTTAENKTP